MKTMLGRILSLGMLAVLATACGSSGSNTAALASNVSGYQTGSASVAGGVIGFSGQASVSQTSVLAGTFPAGSGLGNYGQLVAGASIANAQSLIQFQPKQGTYGTLQMSAGQNSVTGTIQLSQALMQQIVQYYGANAQVTSLAIWSTDILAQSSYQTYTGQIAQAIVYIYINGSYQPVGPIVF